MFRHAWCYRLKQFTLLIIPIVFSGLVIQNAFATDNWNVDGEHGELHVRGVLIEGACKLDMNSAFQEITLGNIAKGVMHTSGDMGKPVAFQLRLLDCQQSSVGQVDRYTGVKFRAVEQPAVTISFLSDSDSSDPSLIAVTGVTGMGLRLVDAAGRFVRLGARGEPQFLTPGDNELVYTIAPVKTDEPLTTGNFRAVVDFEVGYD